MKPFSGKNALAILLLAIRLWFASLLVYSGFLAAGKDIMYRLFNRIGGAHNLLLPGPLTHLAKVIEIVLGFSLLLGLFTRFTSGIVMIMMLAAIIASYTNMIDFGLGYQALAKVLFWFAGIFVFYGAGKWSLDNYLLLKKQPVK